MEYRLLDAMGIENFEYLRCLAIAATARGGSILRSQPATLDDFYTLAPGFEEPSRYSRLCRQKMPVLSDEGLQHIRPAGLFLAYSQQPEAAERSGR